MEARPSDPWVAAERIRLLYGQTVLLLTANLINGALVLVGLWDRVDWRIPLGWGLALVAVAAGRVLLWRAFRRAEPDDDKIGRWGSAFTLGSTLSGLVWGSAPLLFLQPGDYLALTLLAFVIGGTTAGALTSLGTRLATFYWYLAVTLLPLIAHLVAEGGRIGLLMSGMVLLYLLGLGVAGRRFHATLSNNLSLGRQNASLLAGLETQLRQREADLEQTRTLKIQAESASLAKSQFLATMSHEIRTPMNGVIGMTGLLLDTDLESEQRRFAETIRESGEALLTIINDILDYSKMEAGRLDLHPAPFHLPALVDSVTDILKPRAQAKGIDLGWSMDGDQELVLVSDAGRLRQILLNLMGNAVKFTPQGRVFVEIHAEEQTAERAVLRFDIIDTGIGIAKDAQAGLFTMFSQVDSSTVRHYGGTGLGLAICKRLTEMMGGSVGLESEEGQGSRFWFRLPFALAAQLPAKPPPPQPADAVPVRGLRLLLAEDNDVNRQVAIGLLRKQGHHIEVAANGAEAVHAVRNGTFDLVLMDVQMPVMDGLEATKAIRALGGAAGLVPIIAMTANAMLGDEQECLEAGMNAYLSKPIDRRKLEEALRPYTGAQAEPGPVAMPSVELATLDALADDLELETVISILEKFVEDAGARLERCHQALAAGERDSLRREAHAVKGAAASLGLLSIRDACLRLEEAAKSGEGMDDSLAAFEAVLAALPGALRQTRYAL